MEAATEKYEAEMDWLQPFLDDACVVGKGLEVRGSDLREAYVQWCARNGEKPKSSNDYGTALREKGFELGRTKAGKIWHGLGLRTEARVNVGRGEEVHSNDHRF